MNVVILRSNKFIICFARVILKTDNWQIIDSRRYFYHDNKIVEEKYKATVENRYTLQILTANIYLSLGVNILAFACWISRRILNTLLVTQIFHQENNDIQGWSFIFPRVIAYAVKWFSTASSVRSISSRNFADETFLQNSTLVSCLILFRITSKKHYLTTLLGRYV